MSKVLPRFSWLHFSDLHFENKIDVGSADARRKMLDTVRAIHDVDFVFITGDVAHKGNYHGVMEQLKDLAKAINFTTPDKKERILWAVGNHDIERLGDKISIIQEIRKAPNMQAKFDKEMADKKNKLLLGMLGYDDYNDLLDELYEDTKIEAQLIGSHNRKLHAIIELQEVNIIVLDSCLLSCDESDEKKLFVLDNKFNDEFRKIYTEEAVTKMINDRKPTFVLAHHGREFLHPNESRRLADLFKGKVDLYLCGHSHSLLHSKFFDPDTDEADGIHPENTIHQYTCGAGSLDNQEKMVFIHGNYDSGNIDITTYVFNGAEWNKYFGKNMRPRIEIPRFKKKYQLKENDFKLYITGAQGVGKTAISRRIYSIMENSEALQTVEVDVIKDTLREDIEIAEKRFMKAVAALKDSPYNGNHGFRDFYLNNLSSVATDEEFRRVMLATSYELSYEDIDKQSYYIYERIMKAIARHTQKGIPAIIEGLNIPLELLVEYYKLKQVEEPDFNINSVMFVNLFVDSISSHESRLKSRAMERKLVAEEVSKQEDNLEHLFGINEYYREKFNRMIEENPNMLICNIDNSVPKDKHTVAHEIIQLIEDAGNFVG